MASDDIHGKIIRIPIKSAIYFSCWNYGITVLELGEPDWNFFGVSINIVFW